MANANTLTPALLVQLVFRYGWIKGLLIRVPTGRAIRKSRCLCESMLPTVEEVWSTLHCFLFETEWGTVAAEVKGQHSTMVATTRAGFPRIIPSIHLRGISKRDDRAYSLVRQYQSWFSLSGGWGSSFFR